MASPATRTEAALRRTAVEPHMVLTVAPKVTLPDVVAQTRTEAADLKVVVVLSTVIDEYIPFPMIELRAAELFEN